MQTKITTYEEAIAELEAMQEQIVHGSQCFAEIAEVMRTIKERHDSCERNLSESKDELFRLVELCERDHKPVGGEKGAQ